MIIKIERADELENGKKLCHARLMASRPELEIDMSSYQGQGALQMLARVHPNHL